MLIIDPRRLKLCLVMRLVDLLEDILKPPVVLLHDGVFGRQEQRHLLSEAHLEGGVGEAGDRLRKGVGIEQELVDSNDKRLIYLVRVVHAHRHTFPLEVINIHRGRRRSICRFVHQL